MEQLSQDKEEKEVSSEASTTEQKEKQSSEKSWGIIDSPVNGEGIILPTGGTWKE